MPTTSGAGNGPFGFGWSLSLPSITRKTDKGLPQYFDAVDSDVFILSGAEDLVPVYRQDPDGTWIAGRPGFQRVSRYAPARRCERVLMLHHIPDLPAGPGWAAQPGYRGVVHSIEFTYDDELDPTFKLYIERWPVWGLCW